MDEQIKSADEAQRKAKFRFHLGQVVAHKLAMQGIPQDVPPKFLVVGRSLSETAAGQHKEYRLLSTANQELTALELELVPYPTIGELAAHNAAWQVARMTADKATDEAMTQANQDKDHAGQVATMARKALAAAAGVMAG